MPWVTSTHSGPGGGRKGPYTPTSQPPGHLPKHQGHPRPWSSLLSSGHTDLATGGAKGMREPERNFPTEACAGPVPGSEPFLGLPHVGRKMPSHCGQTQSPGLQ